MNENIKENEDGTISPIDPSKPFKYTTDTPSGDLEKRLESILNLVKKSLAEDVQPWVIPQIMAAIKDAGYIRVDQAAEYITHNKLMTGAEWYDRFNDLVEEVSRQFVLEAAKRAAGIDT